jgi:thiamine biosynthesis protein ThiI
MVAEKLGIQGMVTGEALGQVSSQTLTNLRHIDNVTDTLILRPLINWDKEDIINVARDIGTEDFAKTMPEYCGVISKKPTIKAEKLKLEKEEAKFDFSILDQVIYDARVMDIRAIEKESQEQAPEVEMVSELGSDQSKEYLLYCDRGVMSRLQALLLIENGYKNVKVYRP